MSSLNISTKIKISIKDCCGLIARRPITTKGTACNYIVSHVRYVFPTTERTAVSEANCQRRRA